MAADPLDPNSISAHSMGDLHICESTIDAEAYVGILERHMLSSR